MARAANLKLPPRLAGRLAASLLPGAPAAPRPAGALRSWRLAALAGRLAELSSREGAAGLTLAFSLVLDAQRAGEPVGWLTADESAFFPPDAARGGVDLDALVVVRLPAAEQLPRAAEHLARSGAFGLLVRRDAASLGSLVSLRAEARQEPAGEGGRRTGVSAFKCTARVLKDKRGGPGWRHVEVCRGPDGLC